MLQVRGEEMNKLTAEKCRDLVNTFKFIDEQGNLSEISGYALQALEIALPILEQQPADDGWIEWAGGDCPCDYGSVVEVRLRSGNEREARGALSWEWKHYNSICDIIAYRVVKP